MSVSRFKVSKVTQDFNGKPTATVEIDRNNNIVSVRPSHMRTSYSMPLADVANWIIGRCVMAELPQQKTKMVKRGGV